MSTDRVPPYDQQAEAACLGSVLLNNEAMAQIRSVISGCEDFYVEAHRRIFEAMLELSSHGKPIDPVTLGNVLKERGDLEKVGGAAIFSGLLDSVATVANVDHYAGIVRDKAATRKMIYTAQEIFARGFSEGINISEYLAESRKAITLASAFDVAEGPRLVGTDIKEIFAELETGKAPEGMVKTGVGVIDELTGGLWPKLMTVIGGRPGMGKSALVLNIATNAAKQGKKVMYTTLEDDRRMVVLRMLARFGDVDLNNLMLRSVPDNSWPGLIKAANTISQVPLYVDDSAALSSDQIHQRAALLHQMHGLDLLIVDHLGEVADKGESLTAITEAAAKGLRNIAKELNIPVLLAVQLNREVERRNDKRPTLHDLRQSGAIEQVARFIWFLYRRGYYIKGCEDDPDTQLIVAKSSHGKTGMIRLWSDLSRMFMRGWEIDRDGPFPEDNAKHYEKPESFSGEEDRQRKFFENTGPESSTAKSKQYDDWTNKY